jgi:hypothetical protein
MSRKSVSVRGGMSPRKRSLPLPRFEYTLVGVGEQRRGERSRMSAEVFLTPQGYEPRWAFTEDICSSGMFIRTCRGLPIGTRISITIYSGYGKLRVLGRVVHFLEGIGFGCEFIQLEERQRMVLSFLLMPQHGMPTRSSSSIH